MNDIGGGLRGDKSRLAMLKDEEMRDDIEFLTAENKELHLKVKDVCLSNAKLKSMLAEARMLSMREREAREMSSILQDGDVGQQHMIPAES